MPRGPSRWAHTGTPRIRAPSHHPNARTARTPGWIAIATGLAVLQSTSQHAILHGCRVALVQPRRLRWRSDGGFGDTAPMSPDDGVAEFYDDLADDYHLIFEDWDPAIDLQAEILTRLLHEWGVEPGTANRRTQEVGPARRTGHRKGTALLGSRRFCWV